MYLEQTWFIGKVSATYVVDGELCQPGGRDSPEFPIPSDQMSLTIQTRDEYLDARYWLEEKPQSGSNERRTLGLVQAHAIPRKRNADR